MRAADSSAADLRGGGGRRGALARPAMKAPEHGEEEGGEEGAAPPGWLVKEGTAALGGLLSEPALEYAVAQLFDVLQRAAGEQKDVADDLLRIAAQVSVAALNGGHDAANVERHIDNIAALSLMVQSYWYASTPSPRCVMPSCYLGKGAIVAAIQVALDAREEAQAKAYRPQLAFCWLMSAWTLGKFAALTMLELRSLPKLFDPAHLYNAPAWELLTDGPSSRQEDAKEDMTGHVIDFSIDFSILLFACLFNILMWADWFLGYEDFIAILTAFSVKCFYMDISPAARWRSSLLRWQTFGAYEATVPAKWSDLPRPWKYVLRIHDGASLIELSGTVPPGVGPGQKFTHMAPPPPPARRSWWFFGSPPPPPVPVVQSKPTISEPPPAVAPPRKKTPKQQAAVALKRARQKDRKRRLKKGLNPPSPPCSPVDSPPSEPTPAKRMPEVRVMPSLGAALGR